jgi:putative tryptophan/tyrosine transport system substrate-binding protein
MTDVRRRELIALLGGAAAWPLASSAQQSMPVVGILSTWSPSQDPYLRGFRQGLSESGFVEGRNVAIELRWSAEYDQLGALAAGLVERQSTVIVLFSGPASLAAKSITTTIPMVFVSGFDPVTFGMVDSLNRPGGNATGIYFLTSSLEAKRLELLHELVPKVAAVAFLVNPNNPNAEALLRDTHQAARTLGLELRVLQPTNESDISKAFVSAAEQHMRALLVGSDPSIGNQREHIVTLAARYAIPVIYANSEFARAGGLMSYGANVSDAARDAAVYAARILKGEKPTELPVQQSTKVELVINLNTARALGLEVPATLLARADKVIE